MEFHSFSHSPIFSVIFLPFQFIFSILFFFSSLYHIQLCISIHWDVRCPYSPSHLSPHSFFYTFNIGIFAILNNTLLGDVVSSHLKRIYFSIASFFPNETYCGRVDEVAGWWVQVSDIPIAERKFIFIFIYIFIIMHWNSYHGNCLSFEAFQPHNNNNEQRLNEKIMANRLGTKWFWSEKWTTTTTITRK